MTLTQLLEVAAELRVDISSERLQMLLHRAQIQRIHRLSRGRPKVAARMYAAAADLDPNVSTFHLHLGAELSSVGNLTGAAAALTTAIALLQSHPSDDGAGREEEMVRARMGLAIALQGQVADLLIFRLFLRFWTKLRWLAGLVGCAAGLNGNQQFRRDQDRNPLQR